MRPSKQVPSRSLGHGCRAVGFLISLLAGWAAINQVPGHSFADSAGQSNEPEKKPEFPVKMDIQPGKQDADHIQHIVVTLTIHKGYFLFANPPGSEDLQGSETR